MRPLDGILVLLSWCGSREGKPVNQAKRSWGAFHRVKSGGLAVHASSRSVFTAGDPGGNNSGRFGVQQKMLIAIKGRITDGALVVRPRGIKSGAPPGRRGGGIRFVLCLAIATNVGRAANPLQFEVASLKPVAVENARLAQARDFAESALPVGNLPITGRRLALRGATLERLISSAFRLRPRQIVGPPWLSEKRFDVDAMIPSDAPIHQANEMLQTLLEERFELRSHPATQERMGYWLTVGSRGPNLKVYVRKPTEGSNPPPLDLMGRARKPGAPGSQRHELKGGMELLVEKLAGILQSPVDDRTGLREKYDLTLDIPPPMDANDHDPRARVIEAVNKLGLNLKTGKIAVNVRVVDSVEKTPKPN